MPEEKHSEIASVDSTKSPREASPDRLSEACAFHIALGAVLGIQVLVDSRAVWIETMNETQLFWVVHTCMNVSLIHRLS